MKKILLSAVIATSLLTGCASNGGSAVSYADLQAQGSELLAGAQVNSYAPSTVKELEVARTLINTAFLAAKPAYEQFTAAMQKDAVIGNYFAAVEAVKTEEEKKAIYDALAPEDKKAIDAFNNSEMSKQVFAGLGEASLVALKNLAVFEALDTAGLLKSVEFSMLMQEKDKLAFTTKQVAYLNDTVVSAYKNHQIVSAFRSAE